MPEMHDEVLDDADRWRHQQELDAGASDSEIIARNKEKMMDARRKEAEVRELATMQSELERIRAMNDSQEGKAIADGTVQGPVVPLPRSKSGEYGTTSKSMAMSLSTAMFASKWKGLGKKRAQRRSDARKARKSGPRTKPVPIEMRLKTPPGTPDTVCRHPTLADSHMRQPVSRVALDDSRWDDAPPSPQRVPSAMSWNAAVDGRGSVAYRASKSDLAWLQDQSTLLGTVAKGPPLHPPAKGTKGFIGGGVGDTPYWLQSKPSIPSEERQPRASPAPVLQQRSAAEIRWGGVGTLSKQHRVTEERLLVARYVDEQRRRQALGWRSPVRDERTGELSWRTSTPDPDARRRGMPQPQLEGRRRRSGAVKQGPGGGSGAHHGPSSNQHERSYGKAASFFAERDVFAAAAAAAAAADGDAARVVDGTAGGHDVTMGGNSDGGGSRMAAFLASRGVPLDGAASPPPHTPITAAEQAARARQLELSDLGVSIESIHMGQSLRESQKLNLPVDSLNDSISGVLEGM